VRPRVTLALLGALFALAAEAHAKDPSAAEAQLARDMVREASADVKAGKCEDAVPTLEQAIAIQETAEALMYLGDCQVAQGALGTALGTYRRAYDLAEAQKDPLLDVILKKGKAVQKRVPMLTIGMPPGATGITVMLDGKELGEEQLAAPIPVDPGKHTVTAKAEGKQPFRAEVEAAEKARLEVEVKLGDAAAGKGPGPRSRGVPLGTWIAAGAAVALAGGGVGAFVAAGAQAERGREACLSTPRCDQGRIDAVHRLDGAALGLWIGAGVAAGAAVGWWALAPRGDASGQARLVVGPGSLSVVGSF
jgi:hypothetical protein